MTGTTLAQNRLLAHNTQTLSLLSVSTAKVHQPNRNRDVAIAIPDVLAGGSRAGLIEQRLAGHERTMESADGNKPGNLH